MIGTYSFTETTLEPQWEWNHNPDNTKWSTGAGLTLQTATVTSDLYAARNTLTRRMPGSTSTATIALDCSAMKDGDVAGLAALPDSTAPVVSCPRVSRVAAAPALAVSPLPEIVPPSSVEPV